MLTSDHQPMLRPPIKSAMRMAMNRSAAQLWVTPLWPRSCTVKTSWCQSMPRKTALGTNQPAR
jgi:hypothetical protein